MASKKKNAASAGAGALAAGKAAKDNPYVQRLVEDDELRDNLRTAYDSARKAYTRMANGKGPAKALLDDKKTQRELREAATSLRDAADALRGAKAKRKRKRRGRLLVMSLVGAGAALGDLDAGGDELRRELAADTDAHVEATAGHLVERGGQLRGEGRRIERQHGERAQQPDARGGAGRRGQRDEPVGDRTVEEQVLAGGHAVVAGVLRGPRLGGGGGLVAAEGEHDAHAGLRRGAGRTTVNLRGPAAG